MKIVFFGTPQFAVPSLEQLLEHPEIEVLAVVTQPDKPRGRGKKLIPSAVKKVAVEKGIPVWQPKRVKKDGEILAKLRETRADAFAVVAYGQILSPEILAMPKLGCINGHGSILPQYRGAAPIQWCLVQGEKETGMTTMLMDEGMDTGDMLLKSFTPISLWDNAHQLAGKLADMGASLLVETLLKLESGEINPISQDDSQATYARLIQKSDFAIDWSNSALNIHNQIRGFFPNCFTMWRDQKLKIMATLPLGEAFWSEISPEYQAIKEQWETWSSLSGQPGEVMAIGKSFGPIISTGSGLLLVREVQLAGKRPQSGWDFCNGMRLSLGEILLE